MGSYLIEITSEALEDLKKIKKSGQVKDIQKINKIIKELESSPKIGIGKPERLRNLDAEIWSRRINQKDRLVYKIIDLPDKKIIIIQMLGHYSDK